MASKKSYRPWSPEQPFLLPPSPTEWLPEGHLVYFILDTVKLLDLSAIEGVLQAKDPRGERSYNPAMMVALLLYAYCVGVFSSRRIARATYEDVAFRVLTGGQHPHFTRVNAFRKSHQDALSGLFLQGLMLCSEAGLVKLGHVSLDGSKVAANASKHKAMSYDRMAALEKRLTAEIEALMGRAREMDSTEDERFGEGRDAEDIPAELKRRETRLARLREAKAALEKEARQARAARHRELADGCAQRADAAEAERLERLNRTLEKKHLERAEALDEGADDEPPFTTNDGLPKHRPRTHTDGTPHPRAQRNFTDADSRIMESGGAFVQGYNVQAVVDQEHQIVLAGAVTNQPPDAGNLVPMLEQTIQNCGQPPERLSADSGYWSAGGPAQCEALGTEVYIATERRKHWDTNRDVTSGPPPDGADPRERMRWKLRTAEGRAIYSRRKVIVEPVFGQIKEARGFRRFLRRGLEAVQAEWSLVCLTHNLLKLFRAKLRAVVAA